MLTDIEKTLAIAMTDYESLPAERAKEAEKVCTLCAMRSRAALGGCVCHPATCHRKRQILVNMNRRNRPDRPDLLLGSVSSTMPE